MFMHAGWDHILGNMLFLAIFGKNVEDAFGRLGYLALLLCRRIRRDDAADRDDPALRHRGRRANTQPGASGAIAAVLGAYFVLYPNSRILTCWVFPINIPAWDFLGGWFLYQFFESNYALIHPSNTGDSGVAFFPCRWIHLRCSGGQSAPQHRANHAQEVMGRNFRSIRTTLGR